MVEKGLRFDGSAAPPVPRDDDETPYISIPAPWGFAARCAPRGLPDCWLEIIPLNSGCTGVLIGSCDTSTGERRRADARAELLDTGDPVVSMRGLAATASTVVCAVIDGEAFGYCAQGRPGIAITTPGGPPTLLDTANGKLSVAAMEPGATVLLCTQPNGSPALLLADCDGVHLGQIADRVIAGLSGAALLYRHPPRPLSITLPAAPASLSVSRGMLREWLNDAAVDAESCADVLLAVGEATANATEHAVIGAPGPVDMTVMARCECDALRLTVSDNGRWKPAAVSSGRRGHGMHLMNALVDSVELTTGPEGTTVTMLKELT